MYYEQLLLHIFQKLNGERTTSSVYYLLKGKKSGQTIQDVGLFQLYPFFGLLPKLQKNKFDETINQLVTQQLLEQNDDYPFVTQKAVQQIQEQYQFDGWYLRGQEHVFFERLSLVVQTMSQVQNEQMHFLPITKNTATQQWVRQYLKNIHFKTEATNFAKQLFICIQLLPLSSMHKQIFLYKLSGVKKIGWTWAQLEQALKVPLMDLQIMYIEVLHAIIRQITQSHEMSLLTPLIENIRLQKPLTESTQQTAHLFQQGLSLQQIAGIRRLRMSTIEDHIAEMAMNMVDFPLEKFVEKNMIEQIIALQQKLQTVKLKVLKEHFPQLSYFQIKLVLANRGGQ